MSDITHLGKQIIANVSQIYTLQTEESKLAIIFQS